MPAQVVMSAGCRTQTEGRPHPNGNSETLKDQKTRHWQKEELDQMHAGGKRLVKQGYGAADPEFESWLVELWKQK